jgi:hypothetical protein
MSFGHWENWNPQTNKESSIRRCKKNCDHPSEDLANSGYNPHMKYKSLIIIL